MPHDRQLPCLEGDRTNDLLFQFPYQASLELGLLEVGAVSRPTTFGEQALKADIPPLDLSFAALSDATRRGIIDQLGRGDASITSLVDKFQMTLTGMKKHIQVLERAGLVVTQKVGRVRTCKLGKRGLKAEAEWIEAHRKLFEAASKHWTKSSAK